MYDLVLFFIGCVFGVGDVCFFGFFFCFGVGGFDFGFVIVIFGYCVVGYVEWEIYVVVIFVVWMEDVFLDYVFVWDDVVIFDGCLWCGVVDIVIVGYLCQLFLVVGKCWGVDDLCYFWLYVVCIIGEVELFFVFFENVVYYFCFGFFEVVVGLVDMGYCFVVGFFMVVEVGVFYKCEWLFIFVICEGDELVDVVCLFWYLVEWWKLDGIVEVLVDVEGQC